MPAYGLRKHRVEIEIPDAMATKLVEEKTTGLLPSRAERWGIFVALGLLLTVPYFTIQHHVLFPVRVVPLTQLDRLVPLSSRRFTSTYRSTCC